MFDSRGTVFFDCCISFAGVLEKRRRMAVKDDSSTGGADVSQSPRREFDSRSCGFLRFFH